MDIDTLLQSPKLCNTILQELNLSGLCHFSNLHKAYLFKKSNCIVNCSCVLIFLRKSMCYVITPPSHQWYKISANEILEKHRLVLCDHHLAHMVPLPPAELPEMNAFTTITRITFLQAQDTHKQHMYSNIP